MVSLAQRTADAVYEETAVGDVPLASVVRQYRDAWGEQGVASVHAAAREVAACLLHHDDIEVGDCTDKHYSGWQLDPWEADEKISRELTAMADFLIDEQRYIFRRKR